MRKLRDYGIAIIAALLLLGTVGWSDALAGHGRAGLGYAEALKAKREAAARAAHRRAVATRAERDARRWVRRWTAAYGPGVGRWADDALAVGWPESEMWTLGRVILYESAGSLRARNVRSGCAGLMQLSPYWWDLKWHFDPYDPRLNLRYGLRVRQLSGWGAWTVY